MRHDQTARPGTSVSRLLVFAGPLLWAVLVLFHPTPGLDTPYADISDDVNRWLVVHVGQLILTPFLFLAVWRLLDGVTSVAASIGRAALVVWTVFFSAYDSVQGVAMGILTRYANGLPGDEQNTVARAIDFVVSDSFIAGNVSFVWFVATASWVIVAIATALALHQAGAGRAAVVAACLSTVFAVHEAPAAIGLLALAAAGILREQQTTRTPNPRHQTDRDVRRQTNPSTTTDTG